jgi:hypothetical protein
VHLAAGPFLSQHDGAALIDTHYVERVFADIDADYGGCGIEFLWHDVLLVFGAPSQLRLLAGQEHGRTIPLPNHESLFGSPRSVALCPKVRR